MATKNTIQAAEGPTKATVDSMLETAAKRYAKGPASAAIKSPLPAAATPAAIAPAATAGSDDPSDELLEVIRKFSPAFRDMAADLKAVEPEREVAKFAPPKLTIPDGMRSLADLISGCKAIPVRVFDPMEWPAEIRSYIPKQLPNDGKWHWPKLLMDDLAFALFQGDRTLLHGPTGAGKSALAEAWCFLTKTPLIRVNCHREMQTTDFLGKDIIKSTPQGPVLVYDWSLTTLAAKYGGMLLIDEAFRSPHLMCIQSLLERKGTLTLPDAASLTPEERHIVPPEGMSFIVLTDNSTGTGDDSGAYVTEVQDVSTLDRITAAIHVDYTEPAQEAAELSEDFAEIPKKVLQDLTDWADRVRDAFKSGNMQQTVSRRALGAILRKYAVTGNLDGAAKLSFISKLNGADQHKAKESWMQVFGEELA